MNKLQTIFSELTGFEASYQSRGAECEGWEDFTVDQLIDVTDNLALDSIDQEEAARLFNALTEFKNCDSGEGVDLDIIFNNLTKPVKQ